MAKRTFEYGTRTQKYMVIYDRYISLRNLFFLQSGSLYAYNDRKGKYRICTVF